MLVHFSSKRGDENGKNRKSLDHQDGPLTQISVPSSSRWSALSFSAPPATHFPGSKTVTQFPLLQAPGQKKPKSPCLGGPIHLPCPQGPGGWDSYAARFKLPLCRLPASPRGPERGHSPLRPHPSQPKRRRALGVAPWGLGIRLCVKRVEGGTCVGGEPPRPLGAARRPFAVCKNCTLQTLPGLFLDSPSPSSSLFLSLGPQPQSCGEPWRVRAIRCNPWVEIGAGVVLQFTGDPTRQAPLSDWGTCL